MLSSLDDAIEFLRDFHASVLKDVQGLTVDDPEIPDALRKVYAAFGDPMASSSIMNAQDSLDGPSELRARGDFVHFMSENQGCWSCAYRVDGGEDPEVYLFDDSTEGGKKLGVSLSQFLVTYLLQESVLIAPWGAIQEDGILPQDALHEAVETLWLEAIYSSPSPTHWFYWCRAPRILIMRFDGDYAPWLWMGAYADHWESALKDCSGGYAISGPSGEYRCHDSNPPPPAKKRLPRWLHWLEKHILRTPLNSSRKHPPPFPNNPA